MCVILFVLLQCVLYYVPTVELQGFQMHNGRGLQKQPLKQVTDVQMKQLQKMIHYNDNVSRRTFIWQQGYFAILMQHLILKTNQIIQWDCWDSWFGTYEDLKSQCF